MKCISIRQAEPNTHYRARQQWHTPVSRWTNGQNKGRKEPLTPTRPSGATRCKVELCLRPRLWSIQCCNSTWYSYICHYSYTFLHTQALLVHFLSTHLHFLKSFFLSHYDNEFSFLGCWITTGNTTFLKTITHFWSFSEHFQFKVATPLRFTLGFTVVGRL